MTKRQKQLMAELKRIAVGDVPWEFATVDVNAIKFVLSENDRLKQRVNKLLDARLDGGVLLGRDDVKNEVIE